jgi:hypothetical protein
LGRTFYFLEPNLGKWLNKWTIKSIISCSGFLRLKYLPQLKMKNEDFSQQVDPKIVGSCRKKFLPRLTFFPKNDEKCQSSTLLKLRCLTETTFYVLTTV